MVEGILLASVVAGLGLYISKSSDLPKELVEQRKELDAKLASSQAIIQPKKIIVPEIKMEIKKINIEAIDKEINELTYKITSLEQEIRDNNLKNEEIKSQINKHMMRLEELSNIKNA